jgi:coenzyme PQQ biosynthesis protein PqqD
MQIKVELDTVYTPSEDVVAREIEGELIIVPLAAGMGDMEDELFTLNETGRAIWDRLDGKRSLKDVVGELSAEFEAPEGEIETDVRGLIEELAQRKMLVAVAGV